MEERHQQIIIKKVKKKQAGGAHGGSWKVAYADFVTAMMAFFLLLWLLSMVSDVKRAALSEYFRHYSVFQESGSSAIKTKDSNVTDPRFVNDVGNESLKAPYSNARGKGETEFRKKIKKNVTVNDEEIVKKIRTSIDDKMAGIRDQILVDVIEGGIRIQVIDTEGSMMFPLGSDKPTPKAREILKLVADNINEIPGKVVVEGHTDSAPFKGGQITNWELSTARASAARRVLEESGTPSNRIARVVGYADQELLLPLDSRDQRNRRISVIVLQSKE
ncbi:MAG: chemotaxis protein [Deltaproteobacteria bacterium HGW-Deltaproteobacteria-6]|jgi:chemotaxis protein MotB|nr:MAG: chemotaxis protein [Deltaproteobacteria bacterium HGW-Deltaproteobacteria-6]